MNPSSRLTRVTFTGADDTICFGRLADFAREHPIAEWGILIGSKEYHAHRFPSHRWIGEFLERVHKDVNLSLHICGSQLRNIAKGMPLNVNFDLSRFRRCQLNWHGEKQGEISEHIRGAFLDMADRWDPEVIFQLDGVNDGLALACSRNMRRVSGLHDLSHGAGKVPDEWPATGNTHIYLGYAGGLGPDNLREELPKIAEAAQGEYWIDMETKLFDGTTFCLPACAEVLDIVEEWNLSNA